MLTMENDYGAAHAAPLPDAARGRGRVRCAVPGPFAGAERTLARVPGSRRAWWSARILTTWNTTAGASGSAFW